MGLGARLWGSESHGDYSAHCGLSLPTLLLWLPAWSSGLALLLRLTISASGDGWAPEVGAWSKLPVVVCMLLQAVHSADTTKV